MIVNAVIYEWCLDRIDTHHPLFNVSYFGQVVRPGMTVEEAFDARTKQHTRISERDPKNIGLHWAIRAFGADAFTVRILETARLPRFEAMSWANAREIHFIYEHGGVLRDQYPESPIVQTLNLTTGGTGDPKARWQAIQVLSEVAWRKTQRYLQEYYDEKKHLRIPCSYVASDGFKLGQRVNDIRSHRIYVKDHPDREAWLEARGWRGKVQKDAKWNEVKLHLQAYYDDYDHTCVTQHYVTSDGFKLGRKVNDIRSRFSYVKGHPERVEWLKERNFKMNATNAINDAERWAALGDT